MKSGLLIILVLLFVAGALARHSSCLNSRSVCLLKKKTGPCKAYFRRYYFDRVSGQCKKFIYGGCQGNGNNFLKLKDCKATCSQFLQIPPVKLHKICFLPKKVGPCKARKPRYYFNTCTKKCELFYYGGCRANKNNFKTLKECNSKCFYPAVKG